MTNKELIQKADMVLSDLNGARLKGDLAESFYRDAIADSQMLKFVDTRVIPQGQTTIPTFGFGDRILHSRDSGQALPESLRTKPAVAGIEVKNHKYLATIKLPYEVLKYNPEKEKIEQTIREEIGKKAMEEVEGIVLNSDMSSADPDFNRFDGMRVFSGITSFDMGGSAIDPSGLMNMLKKLSYKYRKRTRDLGYFVSPISELNYREMVSNRATVLGDNVTQTDITIKYAGAPIFPMSEMPENIVIGGTNTTEAILTQPKNIIVTFDDDIMFETAKDIESQVWTIVATIYLGFTYVFPEAVVRAYNVGL